MLLEAGQTVSKLSYGVLVQLLVAGNGVLLEIQPFVLGTPAGVVLLIISGVISGCQVGEVVGLLISR